MKNTLIIFILVLVTGCQEQNWGSQYKDFAENKASSLSRNYAIADLNNKWQEVFEVALFSQSFLLENIQERLEATEISTATPTAISEAQSIKEILQVRAIEAELLTIQRRIEDLELGTIDLLNICEDNALFQRFGLENQIKQQIMSITMPGRNVTYALGGTFGGDGNYQATDFDKVFDTISSLFGDSEYQKQKKDFDQGSEILNAKIISGKELFILSSGVCKNHAQRYYSWLDKIISTTQTAKETFKIKQDLAFKRLIEIEAYLVPLINKRVLEREGLAQLFENYEHERDITAISNCITQISERLKEVDQFVDNTNFSFELVKAKEEFEDDLSTSLIQIDDQLKFETNSLLRKRLVLLRNKITSTMASLKAQMVIK